MLSSSQPCHSSRIVVGNGDSLAVTHTGHQTNPTNSSSLSLNNVLVSPYLIKNLIFVKRLARDNPVNVEFDDIGFSVKDRSTETVILRCNDTDDELYPLSPAPTHTHGHAHAFPAVTRDLWHQRLGHPGDDALRRVLLQFPFSCAPSDVHTCHACRLGKHARLPFATSHSRSYFPFQLVHLDVWTSPVASVSGFLYYLVVLDSCNHYVWTFPLHASQV